MSHDVQVTGDDNWDQVERTSRFELYLAGDTNETFFRNYDYETDLLKILLACGCFTMLLVSTVQQSDLYTYIYIYKVYVQFSYFFPLWFITGY